MTLESVRAAAPVPDKDLVRLLEQAADRASDPSDTRELLLQTGQSVLLK